MPKIVWGRSLGWNIEFNKKMKAPPGYQWVRIRDMQPTEIITDGCDCYPWHEVFAWWPVRTVAGKVIWWRKIYKRKVWMVWGSGFHMEPETQYATAFDLIKEPL